jgi:hypothetical protein
MNKRLHARLKGVLPVKLSGRTSDGIVFEEIAHTLDITPTGARLGAVRRLLRVQDRLTLRYRQRKTEFRVVWIWSLKNTGESQVGLQTVAPGNPWCL